MSEFGWPSLTSTDDTVTARFDGVRRSKCDLLVGADGPGSTVRRQLLPDVRSRYAGYVAWRGVMLEHDAPILLPSSQGGLLSSKHATRTFSATSSRARMDRCRRASGGLIGSGISTPLSAMNLTAC